MKHIARKRFGQHLLSDHSVIPAIVDTIDPQPPPPLVEMGPRLAPFTQPLSLIRIWICIRDRPWLDCRRSTRRAVPTRSLDSGVVFESEANLLGRDLLQTLEPRACLLYTSRCV